MKRSFQLGVLFGVPIRLHVTFLLVVAVVVLLGARSANGAVMALLTLVVLFSCVVLHELGHALMGRLFGVRTREIILLPIGGMARLEGMPAGVAELAIALAGPAVNLGLALILFTVAVAARVPPMVVQGVEVGMGQLLYYYGVLNLALMGFNLLPAFPMDGGRVLRAFLSLFVPMAEATRWAARVGQVIAVGMAVLALLNFNPFLFLIALFVFFGAAQEALFQQGRTYLTGRMASEAMMTRFEKLAPQQPLTEASKLLLESSQTEFPVVDAWGRLAGVLRRPDLLAGISRRGSSTAVLEIMEREVPVTDPEAPLEKVMEKLQNSRRLPVFVVENDRLVGIVTQESIAELAELSRLQAVPAPSRSSE